MKIELERVKPAEIEKRSFEIISQELEQKGIVLPQEQEMIPNGSSTPVQILIMLRLFAIQRTQ